MSRNRRNVEFIDTRNRSGRRIRARAIRSAAIPDGYKGITAFPGFDASLQAPKHVLCMDENTGIIKEALAESHLNVKFEHVEDVGLKSRDDNEIVAWAKKRNGIIVTYNAKHFLKECKGREIHQMPGLIAITTQKKLPLVAGSAMMVALVMHQLGRNTTRDWWRCTKIKVTLSHLVIRKYRNGQRRQYKAIPSSATEKGILFYTQIPWQNES